MLHSARMDTMAPGPSGRKVFIYPADSYFGRSLGPALAAIGCEVLGAYHGDAQPSYVSTGYQVGTAGAEAANRQFLALSDAVIYELHGHTQAARDALVGMTRQPWGGRQQAFIGVSTPLVWAATRPPPPAPPPSEGEGYSDDGSFPAEHQHINAALSATTKSRAASVVADAAAEGSEGALEPAQAPLDVYAAAAAFGALTERDAPRRAPCLAAREVHEVEQLIVRSQRKGRLRTAVVCPGLLYGQGEDDAGLHPYMRTAWEVAGPLTIYGPGTNHLPMVHVDDAAGYVAAVASAQAVSVLPETQQYMLVTDGAAPGEPGGVEQGVLVKALAESLGVGNVMTIPGEDLIFARGGGGVVDRWTLGAKLTTTPLPPGLPRPTPKYAAGIMAHLTDVVGQWQRVRGVTPLRIVLAGPPMSGKTCAGARLAAAYGLKHIGAKDLLAAADKLGPEAAKALQGEMSGKEPRASSKSMAALLRALLGSDKRVANRGYVLDGWPRTLGSARWAFMQVEPLSEQEKAQLEQEEAALRSVAASGAKDPKAKPGAKPAAGGKKDAKGKGSMDMGPEVPAGHKLAPDPATAPSHVVELEVGDVEMLKGRMKAVEAAELEAARVATPPADAKPAKGGKEKGGAATSHNNEKDFVRRLDALNKMKVEEKEELEARIAAAQERYEQLAAAASAAAAAAAAEAATLRAKRRRAREAAAAAAAAAGDIASSAGGAGGMAADAAAASGTLGSTAGGGAFGSMFLGTAAAASLTANHSPGASFAAAGLGAPGGAPGSPSPEPASTGEAPAAAGPKLPQYPGMVGVAVEGCGAKLAVLPNLDREGGPPVENEAWRTTRVPELEAAMRASLGTPHNFEGLQEEAIPDGSATGEGAEGDAGASNGAAGAFGSGAAANKWAVSEEALSAQADEAARAFSAAMGLQQAAVGAPIRQFLMSVVMPTVADALRILAAEQPPDPLRFLAEHLLAEADRLEDVYIDPYSDPKYNEQLAKLAAKAAREQARAEAAAAKAEKELAAKQAARAAEDAAAAAAAAEAEEGM